MASPTLQDFDKEERDSTSEKMRRTTAMLKRDFHMLGALLLSPERFGSDFWPCKNVLICSVASMGTESVSDVIRLNETGIDVWRQEEGCDHCNPVLGPFSLTWDQLQKLSEAKENFNMEDLFIPKASFGWLLGLKEKVVETKTENPSVKERVKI